MARLVLIGLYTGTRHETIIKARWDRTLHAPWIDIEAGIMEIRLDEAVPEDA